MYASAARLAVINAVASLSASADVLAMSTVEVDLGSIQPGQTITVKWRGKPVFIKHRTDEQIKLEADTNTAELRHKQTDAERVKDPKWCVNRPTRLCRAVSGSGVVQSTNSRARWLGVSQLLRICPNRTTPSFAGSLFWACARTSAASLSRTAATTTGGTAPAMVATTTARGASGAGPRRSTLRCPITNSSTEARRSCSAERGGGGRGAAACAGARGAARGAAPALPRLSRGVHSCARPPARGSWEGDKDKSQFVSNVLADLSPLKERT